MSDVQGSNMDEAAEDVSEETPDTEKQAENLQQFYYECFGDRDWDAYNFDEHIFLKRNIGYAIFGNPNDDKGINDNIVKDADTGYTKRQEAQIQEIYQAIMENHFLEDKSVVLMRIIFVCCQLKNEKKSLCVEPVFIVKKCHSDDYTTLVTNCKIFIDSNARVYQNWDLFLNNNKLPKCTMFFPKDGQYKGQIVGDDEVRVIIDKMESPACNIGNVILDGADTVGTVASVGTTVVLAAAAIPSIAVAPAILVGAAVTGAGVGIYSVVRSTQTLIDRKLHQQKTIQKGTIRS